MGLTFAKTELTVDSQGCSVQRYFTPPIVYPDAYVINYNYIFFLEYYCAGKKHTGPDEFFYYPGGTQWASCDYAKNIPGYGYSDWAVSNQELVTAIKTVIPGVATNIPHPLLCAGNDQPVVVQPGGPIYFLYGRVFNAGFSIRAVTSTVPNPLVNAMAAAGDKNPGAVSESKFKITFTIPKVATVQGPFVLNGVYQTTIGAEPLEKINVWYQVPYSDPHLKWTLTGTLASYFEVVVEPMVGTDSFYTTSSIGNYSAYREGTLRLRTIAKIPQTMNLITGTLRVTRKSEFVEPLIHVNDNEVSLSVNAVLPPPVQPFFTDINNEITDAYDFTIYDNIPVDTLIGRLYTRCDDPHDVYVFEADSTITSRFEVTMNSDRFWVNYKGGVVIPDTTYLFFVKVVNIRDQLLNSTALVSVTVVKAPVLPVLGDRSYKLPISFPVVTGLTYGFTSENQYSLIISNKDGTATLYMRGILDSANRVVAWERNTAASYSAGVSRVMKLTCTNLLDPSLIDTADVTFSFFANPTISPSSEIKEVYSNVNVDYVVTTQRFVSVETPIISATYYTVDANNATTPDLSCPFWINVGGDNREFSVKYNGARPLIVGEKYRVIVLATVIGDINGITSYMLNITITPPPQQPVFSNIEVEYVVFDNITTMNIGLFNVTCNDAFTVVPSPWCDVTVLEKFTAVQRATTPSVIDIRYTHDPLNPLDSDARSVYYLKVRAINSRDSALVTDAVITIKVLPFCLPPTVSSKNFNVAEDAPTNTIIGNMGAVANGAGGLAYSIVSGNQAGLFSISADGSVVLVQGGVLDYTSGTRTYVMLVKVFAAINMITYTSTSLTINVLPSNAIPPKLNVDVNGNLSDLQYALPVDNHEVIGIAPAITLDGGGIFFTMEGTSNFGIHAGTGEIYVKNADALNANVDDFGLDSAYSEFVTIKATSFYKDDATHVATMNIYPIASVFTPYITRYTKLAYVPTTQVISFSIDLDDIYDEAVIGTIPAHPSFNVWYTFPDSSHVLSSGFGITNGGSIYIANAATVIANSPMSQRGITHQFQVNVFSRDNPQDIQVVNVSVVVFASIYFRQAEVDSSETKLRFYRTVDHGNIVKHGDLRGYFRVRGKKTASLSFGSINGEHGGMVPCLPEYLPSDISPLGGTWEPDSPEYCNYRDTTGSIMVYLQAAGYDSNSGSVEWSTASQRKELCFMSAGKTYPGIFVDKYPVSYDGVSLRSNMGLKPVAMDASLYPEISGLYDFSDMPDGWNHPYSVYSLARLRGVNNFLLPYSVKVMLDRIYWMRYYRAKLTPGNAVINHHSIVGRSCNCGELLLGDSYKYIHLRGRIPITGSGGPDPAASGHNGELNGVMDFYSGQYEFLGGHYVSDNMLKLPTPGLQTDITISPFEMSVENLLPDNKYSTLQDISRLIKSTAYYWTQTSSIFDGLGADTNIGVLPNWSADINLHHAALMPTTATNPSGSLSWVNNTGIGGCSAMLKGLRVLLHAGPFRHLLSPTPMRFIDIRDHVDIPLLPATFRTCRFPINL